MIDTVQALASELRRTRVPVSTSDLVTAAEALAVTDMTDREAVREVLASNLAKAPDHRDTFDLLFELYFTPVAIEASPSLATLDDIALKGALTTALLHRNRHLQREIAAIAVERFARIEPGRRSGSTFYMLRTLRGLGIDSGVDMLGDAHPDEVISTSTLGGLGAALTVRRAQESAELFERIVESEVRRRLVADRGADAVAGALRHPLPEDSDFLTSSTETIQQMTGAIAPLSRQLSRILAARQRSAPRRRLDVRRTIRASLSTGGSPVRLLFRPARPPKPRLIVIADISGSVAGFAAFALQLTYALRSHFTRLRAFVFVNDVDEVTDLLTETSSISETTARINRGGRGVRLGGQSDYGVALGGFIERHLHALDDRTIVLILGDARNNFRDPRPDALKKIRDRVAAVYWLNPENAALWNDGDAVTGTYAPYCDAVVECRSIRQLKTFVARLG
ncbi:VWA domain-containing protein [Microbacterium sp.]|uniref:VWA domain-containing protein n=1 Tax=Microbacterium sp. TaxID=51671 RepID=UPI00273445D2|nr:VWA domain-containing protein [Microbacterium sp.]MDP3950263.1 VWA domain-containing protein [Microbacterium sp.]